MPKLLSLNNYHYRRGGSDAMYFDHEKLFQQLGWETANFAMHHPNNEASPWSEYFIDELEFGFDYNAWQKCVMASKVIYSFEAASQLKRLLSSWRPDVAHAHCIYHHLSPSVLQTLHQHDVPVVMTAHDLKIACPAYKMFNAKVGVCESCRGGNLTHLLRHQCIHGSLAVSALVMVESYVHRAFKLYKHNLDKIICPSEFFKQKLIQWGWSQDILVTIPNFIDNHQYQPQYTPGDYFIYFGRLSVEKGIDILIRAAAKAKVALKIVGTGPQEVELKKLAQAQNAEIEFTGYLQGQPLQAMIQNSRAVVLPSIWYENAPVSLLEAYACGKVVIGADIGGIPEMIIAEQTGFMFQSADVGDLTQRLIQIQAMADSQLTTMGVCANELVQEKYNPVLYQEKMLNLYRELGVRA